MTSECRTYKEAGRWQVKSIIREPHQKLKRLEFLFYWGDNRRRDTDNAIKIIQDCLKGTLVVDDSWQCIDEVTIKNMGIDKSNPRVIIKWEA